MANQFLCAIAAFRCPIPTEPIQADMCAEEKDVAKAGAALEGGAKWHDEVEKAADLLIEIYGTKALTRARSVQSHSVVGAFAEAVTRAVQRKLTSA